MRQREKFWVAGFVVSQYSSVATLEFGAYQLRLASYANYVPKKHTYQKTKTKHAYQMMAVLDGSEPKIWRQISVPGNMTLDAKGAWCPLTPQRQNLLECSIPSRAWT